MDATGTKTTFYLSSSLRARLKALAAKQGRSMSQLLAEGAELVLAREEATEERDELLRRAQHARERLREGLYDGAPVSSAADALVYGTVSGRRLPRRAGRTANR